MRNLTFFSLFIFFLPLTACRDTVKIQSGDLIFRGNNNSGLSKAINDVTTNNNRRNYSHVGICIQKNDTIWVYHACPGKGVCKDLLKIFCKPDTSFYYSDLYRINTQRMPPDKILERIDNLLGEKYDSTYIIKNPGMYCSEFIYEVYKPLHIFKLYPMTFKDPKTGKTHEIWQEYYKKLGIPIPEGEPGCNPNQMATNDKLIYLFRVNPDEKTYFSASSDKVNE